MSTEPAPRVIRPTEGVHRCQPPTPRPSLLVDLPTNAPFLNFERAYALMEANQVDALVVGTRPNVFYMTGYRQAWLMDNDENLPIAILTRRQGDGIALVMTAWKYYYSFVDGRPAYPFNAYLYSEPDGSTGEDGEPGAVIPQHYRNLGFHEEHAIEAHRGQALRQAIAEKAPTADATWALRKAIRDLGLAHARIAVDDPALAARIAAIAPEARIERGDNLIRRIRQVKSPLAIAAGKVAAQANSEAARAAVQSTARAGATYRELRAAFFSEVSLRGGAPLGFLINQTSSNFFDAEFKDGDSFMIDAVSEFGHCYGDFGRTICIGEPVRGVKRAAEASELAWRAVRDRLKPGLRYSEVRAIGLEALRRDGYDVDVKITAHAVGLAHTEDPYRPDLPFFVADSLIEPGMVLSIDFPVTNTGYGGSAHLEDLVVITPDGHEALNDTAHPVIRV